VLPLTGAKLIRAEQVLAQFAQVSDTALVSDYQASANEKRLFCRAFDRDLMAAFEQAIATDDQQQRAVVERAVRATLGDFPGRTSAELAARITTQGSADSVNLDMRDACLHFAMLYRLTGDLSQAERAAAILARFAAVIPAWPIWQPYYGAQSTKQALPQSGANTFATEFSAGLWGNWIYFDLILGTPLVQANAIISGSGATKAINAEAAIEEMFNLHIATQRKYGNTPDYSNMDAFQIRGFMDFGKFMPNPELIHEGVRHLQVINHIGFFPDGWWWEGATSYHLDLTHNLSWLADDLLRGYSDPPGFQSTDGSRYDNLDLSSLAQGSRSRAEAVVQRTTMPDGNLMAIHDTGWPERAPGNLPGPTSSHLFGAMGQGSLITGSDASFSMATLHWGGTGTHAHFDALNLNLWSKGYEAISGTQYRPLPGSTSTRAWHTSTAAQATVVVNGVNQGPTGLWGSHLRVRQPEDAIPGVADWAWRWTNGNRNDSGHLQLFSTDFSNVQVVEADATRAYDMVAGVTMYRRTIGLVKIDDLDSYVIDIFRVRGGSTHDFMLHSCLQSPAQLEVSLPMQPMSGTVHGLIGGLRSTTTGANWLAVFGSTSGSKLLTFMAGAPGTSVIAGEAPSTRQLGNAPFLMARRTGGDSTFVAVHHVVSGNVPRIQGIELIPTNSPDCVAVKVKIGDRTDTIISCTDRSRSFVVDGGMEIRGKFAHISSSPVAEQNWDYLVDGDYLRTPRTLINGEVSHSGIVQSTRSLETGDAVDGLVVSGSIPAGIALQGSTVIVDQAGDMTWAYRIRQILSADGGTLVQTSSEPGFVVNQGVIKQTYFPCWGFVGQAKCYIPGSALMQQSSGGTWSLVQSGAAEGSVLDTSGSP
jgi:hypothetical protein